MSNATIKVGIIGLREDEGWAQRAHLPALRALDGFEVTAVANSNADSSKRAAARFGLQAFDSAAALARDPSVDLVAVTVKVPHHRELVDAVLGAGKMVYCEWPLGNGLSEAEAMAAQAQSAGVRTLAGLQARSAPIVRYVRSLIADGFVGEVLSTTLVGSGGIAGAETTARDAYINDASNGADLISIPFGHTIDALCHCLGEFAEVEALTTRRRATYRVTDTGEEKPMLADDQLLVAGKLGSGVAVSAHYRGGSSRGTNLRWEINGTQGDLEITAPSGHLQLTSASLRGGRGADKTLAEMPMPSHFALAPAGLTGGAVNVAEAYLQFAAGQGATYPVPDFDEALHRHRLIDAIRRSAREGSRIAF